MSEEKKYVIIPISEVENIDFNLVEQTSAETLRISEDGEYTFVKFTGDTTPSFLDGYTQYNHSEVLSILNDTSGIWYIDEEESLTWRENAKVFIDTIKWSNFNPFNWF